MRPDPLSLKLWGGLAEHNAVFSTLRGEEKRTPLPWSVYREWHRERGSRIDIADSASRRGKGIGIIGADDIWALDNDTLASCHRAEEVCADWGIIPPMFETPRGMRQMIFRWPPAMPTARLKAHIVHPKDDENEKQPWDFKLLPSMGTLLVIPESPRKGAAYRSLNGWPEPPVMDPRAFHPNLELWHPPDQLWLPDQRPKHERIFRARGFLERKAPVCIPDGTAHKNLGFVVAHLIGFLGLKPAEVYSMITEPKGMSWNDRNRNMDGSLYPWSSRELRDAIEQASQSVPTAGVALWERKSKQKRRDDAISAFIEAMRLSVVNDEGRYALMQDLTPLFCSWSGIERDRDLETSLGIAIRKAGFTRKLKTHQRIEAILGLDLRMVPHFLRRTPSAA